MASLGFALPHLVEYLIWGQSLRQTTWLVYVARADFQEQTVDPGRFRSRKEGNVGLCMKS